MLNFLPEWVQFIFWVGFTLACLTALLKLTIKEAIQEVNREES